MDDEECFPRGKPKQKLKQKRSKVEDVSDSEENEKDVQKVSRKKLKSSEYDEDMVNDMDAFDDENLVQDIPYLTYNVLHEGMLILGCVVAIHSEELTISLPFAKRGSVNIMHVSSLYADAYSKQSYSSNVANFPQLLDLFEIGQLVVCSVMKVNETSKKMQLTLDPKILNSNYDVTSMNPGALLCGVVRSVEDHGYIVDIGKERINAFIPSANVDQNTKFKRFQFVRCCVTEVKGNGRVVLLSCQNKLLTKVPLENEDVEFLYPGKLVKFVPEMITRDGKIGKVGLADACVSMLHLLSNVKDGKDGETADQPKKKKRKGNTQMLLKDFLIARPREKFFENDSVKKLASVLYTSADGVVVLSANPVMWKMNQRTQDSQEKYAIGQKYGAKIIEKIPGLGCVCQFHKSGVLGLVTIDNLSDRSSECNVNSLTEEGKLKVRIIDNQSVDGVIELSAKKSIYDAMYLSYDDVQPGEIVSAKVLDISSSAGLKVSLGSWQDKKFLPCNLRAVVPPLHVSDILLKRPEKIFRTGDVLTCKVLQVNKESQLITLTNKKTFVQSSLPTITGYQQLNVDDVVHAYIKAIKAQGCIVGMCNNVKGFVPKNEITLPDPSSPISEEYSLGQVVRVRVCARDVDDEKLIMSFKTKQKKKLKNSVP